MVLTFLRWLHGTGTHVMFSRYSGVSELTQSQIKPYLKVVSNIKSQTLSSNYTTVRNMIVHTNYSMLVDFVNYIQGRINGQLVSNLNSRSESIQVQCFAYSIIQFSTLH